MGTRFKIVLYARDAEQGAQASRAAFDRIAHLDEIMSDYRQDSELMRLCAEAGGPPVKVSGDLFRVLGRSQEISRLSDGAFDITVGPVVRLWRRARRMGEMPASEQLGEALQLVGYQKIRMDSRARTIQLTRSGMLLDLGGIAKGFAADEAQVVLRRQGIRSALVAAGGDIAVSDAPPGEKGWTVGIASLEDKNGPAAEFLLLSNAGVSTSGDVEQFVEIGGKRYSHIVDPRTGVAIIGHSSATVVARDATVSDGLATAISAMGPERGLRLIDSLKGAAALFMQASEQGFRQFESKRWKGVPKGKPRKKGGRESGGWESGRKKVAGRRSQVAGRKSRPHDA
ncbi:MAG TPA: FAD:protein FMN transferase [Acidobacteriota bacterium]|jgi:thiamine biosynthesis lipoprotein